MDATSLVLSKKYTDEKHQVAMSELSDIATEVETKADKLKVAEIDKDLTDFQRTLASVNVNQEAKQTLSGYGNVSFPKTAANGQVSARLIGQSYKNIIDLIDSNNDGRADCLSALLNSKSYSFSNGVQKIVGNAANNYIGADTKTLNFINGNKYYIRWVFKASNITNVVEYTIRNAFGTAKFDSMDFKTIPTDTSFKIVSGIYTCTQSGTSIVSPLVFFNNAANTIDITCEFTEPLYINLSELGLDVLTKEECEKRFKYVRGDSTKSTFCCGREKSVGKNLANPKDMLYQKNMSAVDGSITNQPENVLIKVNTTINTQHYHILPTGWVVSGIFQFLDNKFIVSDGSLLSKGNIMYVKVRKSDATVVSIAEFEQFKNNYIIAKTTLTAYEPYTESNQYFTAKDSNGNIVELRSLPNGTKDEVRLSDGKGVIRTKKHTILDTELEGWNTGWTNVNTLILKLPSDCVIFASPVIDGKVNIENWSQTTTIDSISNVNKYVTRFSTFNRIDFIFSKEITESQAREQLAGKELNYQLATPIETPIEVSGTLLSYPSGTVWVENAVADAGIYTDKFTILQQDLLIKEIEKISKVDFTTGVETQLDVTKAVIAGDKKSFTHPNLTANDIVFTTYFYDKEGTQGELSVEYYDSRYVLKDSVTSKYYKVVQTVANGVLSQALVEV